MTTAPNDTLRAMRLSMLLTQEDFAERLRAAGEHIGVPNDANRRLVQRWERGVTTHPRPAYARALQMVTGLPIEQLGFPSSAERVLMEDGRGGHDLLIRAATPLPRETPPRPPLGSYSGIWLSRYEYFSSGREQALEGLHNALLLQQGDHLTVRSIAGSAESLMGMELTVEGTIVTGTWFEQTEEHGYYRGARYSGAIQMLADPTGRRMTGKWLGFGKGMDINTGPWMLTFQDASTTSAAIAQYARPVRQTAGQS